MSHPRGYRTDAIVLRTVDFAETSQVVHLATPDHGLVAAIAKGGHGPKAPFEGGLTLGVLGEADLSPRRGAELELLRSFRVTDALRGLRDDLDRFAAGSYVLELLRVLERPGLAAPALFSAGVATLKALAAAPPAAAPMWVLVFEGRALAASGHRPHLASCVACGGAFEGGTLFSPAAGGAVHPRCAPAGPTKRLDAAGLAALRRLYSARLPELAAEPLADRDLAALRAVHDLFVPWVLEREPHGLRGLPRA